MKIQLNSRASDIVIGLYLIGMLYFRFHLEQYLEERYILSITFGVLTLLFLWYLIDRKVLNPDYFGLLKKKKRGKMNAR